MKSLSNLFSSFKSVMYKNYGENPGKMLVHTGVLGWILSSMAQVSAVMFNDKIPKEQKSFLIPQEIADAAINIISFYVVTSSFKNIASKLVSTGKLSTKSIRAHIERSGKNLSEYLGKIDTDIAKDFPEIKGEYKTFKNGVDVLASTVGSVISCNIITPVLRNEYAARKQKQIIAKMNGENKKQPVLKPNRSLSMEGYIKMASEKYPSSFYSSNLKI